MRFHARVLLVLGLSLPLGGVFAAGCGGTKTNSTLSGGTQSSASGAGGFGGTMSSSAQSSGTQSTGSSGGTGGAGGHGGMTTGSTTGSGAADGGTGGSDGGTSTSSSSGNSFDGGCLNLGAACTTPMDCCSGNCVIAMGATMGVCQPQACVPDGTACTSSASCCSGNCTGNVCQPLNTSCSTLGNPCGSKGCCSGFCLGGVCSQPSFCTQNGDMCSSNADCCGGLCTKQPGMTLGVCSQVPGGASNCGLTDGELCGGTSPDGGPAMGSADAGIPSCGGACCSRLCAPYGPTDVLICQPATGCHVVGDVCTQDSDCCGSAGLPGQPNQPVTCNIAPGNTVGICRNPIGCKPDGDVCKLATMSCNASCDCCSGNCENLDTCKLDNLGVPRCAAAQCVMAGGSCATSANCCNNLPCVPNPMPGAMPPYICYQSSCVPACGPCTVNADCCPGESCVVPIGSTHGICGPCNPPPPQDAGPDSGSSSTSTSSSGSTDGGSSSSTSTSSSSTTSSTGGMDGGVCALYGQQCTTPPDGGTTIPCCNAVPCLTNVGQPCGVDQTGCTCHFFVP